MSLITIFFSPNPAHKSNILVVGTLHSQGFLKNECGTCEEEYELSLDCELEVN